MMGGGETIFALASGAGRAGVAVIRLSGPAVPGVLDRIAGGVPAPRRATLRTLRDPVSGDALDSALVLHFPAPASYTGEDVAEFHVHGGLAVIEAVAGALVGCGGGVRPAEPGEFTRRAFLNGRVDLTAAEGIADLIAAETQAQRRQALLQAGGALAGLVEGWAGRLTKALALCEAAIDFSDDGVGDDIEAEAMAGAADVATEMEQALAGAARAERVREGFRIAIIGAPNAGKSSLLNRLAGRDAAIVAARAGTTRDVIEVRLDVGGFAVTIADTAGLRETSDEIEAEGVRRARAWAGNADLVLAVFDGAAGEADAATCDAVLGAGVPWVGLSSKADVGRVLAEAAGQEPLAVSAVTGMGIDQLLERVRAFIGHESGSSGSPVLTRARHRAAVVEAAAAIRRSSRAALPELRGEELRGAVTALGRLTGRVDVEDLLDIVFGSFCIGK